MFLILNKQTLKVYSGYQLMFDSQQGCARNRLKSYLSSKASSPLRVQARAHLSPRISSAPHPLLVPTTTL